MTQNARVIEPQCIARCTLPLSCAPTLNEYARMHWSIRGRVKLDAYTHMLGQLGRRKTPLAKPTIVLVRYSTLQPDKDCAFEKIPIDVLKSDKHGLGWLVDDSPAHVNVHTRWVKAKRGEGKVTMEIFAT